MKGKTLVVAAHPDDETLGAGGTLLRCQENQTPTAWLIATTITEELGYSPERIKEREKQINRIQAHFGFDQTFSSNFPTTQLDSLPLSELIQSFGEFIEEWQPETILTPFPGDVHSDHKVVFDAIKASTKSFRHPSIKHIYCYETPSETEFGLPATNQPFEPNVFIDVSDQLEGKIDAMDIYHNEIDDHPFPRSKQTIRALASWRGSTAGVSAAEAFSLQKEIM